MVAIVSGAQNMVCGLNTALQQKCLCIKNKSQKKKKPNYSVLRHLKSFKNNSIMINNNSSDVSAYLTC